MLNFSDIKSGSVINFSNQPCVIVSCDFLRMQMRKPVKKCKLKNLISGNSIDYSFKSGESVEEADLKKSSASFMYNSADGFVFMTEDTYETIELSQSVIGDKQGYLKEGLVVQIVYFNDEAISIELPIKISYLVTDTTDVVKGNSVSDVMKDAILETGLKIKVPGFITKGEKITVNTVEKEYYSRDTDK
jgi:elongation factor P